MKAFIKIMVILTFFFGNWFGTACKAQPLTQKMNSYISGYQGVMEFSGVVLVSKNDSIIFQRSYGMANYEWNIRNTVDSKFRIASLSKAFTAVLVLQMAEKGLIQLDGKISDYLSDYPSMTGDSITIHQLLCHTSGIPHYDAITDYDPKYTRLPVSSSDYIKVIAGLDLVFSPGTRYHYSSFGYFLLGVILERVSGLSFSELLKKNILIPAGMNDTSFDDMTTLQPFRASGYNFDQSGIMNCNFEDTYKSIGCGGMISTTRDLFLWNRAISSDLILSKHYRNMLFKKNIGPSGYGWMLRQVISKGNNDTLSVAFHAGSDFGFASYISKNLTNGTCIIILSNLESAPVQKIGDDLSKILMNEEVQPPVVKKYVNVPQSTYSKFAGSYKIGDYQIEVFEEKHGLSMQWTGLRSRLLLFASSENMYFLRETSKEFIFNSNEKGEIKSLSFNDKEGVITAMKVQ